MLKESYSIEVAACGRKFSNIVSFKDKKISLLFQESMGTCRIQCTLIPASMFRSKCFLLFRILCRRLSDSVSIESVQY